MAENKSSSPSEAEWKTQGFHLLSALLNEIDSSKEWCYIQQHDPCILAAEHNVTEHLDRLSKSCGEETVCILQEEIQGYASAYSDAAILNGIRVAFKLLYALHYPLEMSQYIHNRWQSIRENMDNR